MKPILAIDWDGTLVDDVYPNQGDWVPGALTALFVLRKSYQIYIHSCRIAPAPQGNIYGWRDPHHVHQEISYIRSKLDEEGLTDIKIWDLPFKIPAMAYIDNRAVAFRGCWPDVLKEVNDLRDPDLDG